VRRRNLDRGRLLAAIGAIVMLIGCIPAWYTVGGAELPPRSSNAFDGAGILVFVAAVGVLALIALPFAAGDDPMPLDRPFFFGVAAVLGAGAFVLRIVQLLMIPTELGDLTPGRGPGLWITGVGLLVTLWGVADIFSADARERRRR
jgi:hypothetical protein